MITVRALSMLVETWSRDGGAPVSWHEMVSVRRSRAVCRARSWVIWLARRHTSLSLPQIGRQMGGRDHTTILYNCRVIDGLIAKADPATLSALSALEGAVAAHAAEAVPTDDVAPPIMPRRFVAYDHLVDAVEAVLLSADAAALARGTREARAAEQAFAHALSSLRSARTRIMSVQEPRVPRAGTPGRRQRRDPPATQAAA